MALSPFCHLYTAKIVFDSLELMHVTSIVCVCVCSCGSNEINQQNGLDDVCSGIHKIGHGFFNQLQMMQSSSVELQTTVVNRNASRHSRWAGLPIEMHR